MRRYFVTAVDAETGRVVFAREIVAGYFAHAQRVAHESATRENRGKIVRITSITEQLTDLRESSFARAAAGFLAAS